MAASNNGRGQTRVLVSAASAVRRAGLESLLRQAPGLKLAGGVYNLGSVLVHTRDLQVDAVIVDLDRPDPQLVSVVTSLKQAEPRVGLIVLIDNPEPAWTRQVLGAGVNAILARELTREELLWSIQAAHAGLVLLDPAATHSLTHPSEHPSDATAERMGDLTERELQVLRMLADGLANKQIGVELGISEHTVKYHISSILDKLGASGRTEAVTLGIRHGLVLI
jgi:two-component system, NarL family, response regulator YdfI